MKKMNQFEDQLEMKNIKLFQNLKKIKKKLFKEIANTISICYF